MARCDARQTVPCAARVSLVHAASLPEPGSVSGHAPRALEGPLPRLQQHDGHGGVLGGRPRPAVRPVPRRDAAPRRPAGAVDLGQPGSRAEDRQEPVHPDLRYDLERLLRHRCHRPAGAGRRHLLARAVRPEGNEFCCFARRPDQPEADVVYELVVDSADPTAQAAWWADVLGGTVGAGGDVPWRWVEGSDGMPFLYLVFTRCGAQEREEPLALGRRVRRRRRSRREGSHPAASAGRRHRLARARRPGRQRVCAFASDWVRGMTRLDLSLDAAALTVALCDIESVSGNEPRLAEAIELVLRSCRTSPSIATATPWWPARTWPRRARRRRRPPGHVHLVATCRAGSRRPHRMVAARRT